MIHHDCAPDFLFLQLRLDADRHNRILGQLIRPALVDTTLLHNRQDVFLRLVEDGDICQVKLDGKEAVVALGNNDLDM